MKLKLYIAGSWENRSQVRELMIILAARGHIITVDWTWHTDQSKARQYAGEDIQGIIDCDALIYCHDGLKTGGKVYELGFAHGLGKKIVIYSGFIPPGTPDPYRAGCVFVRADNMHPRAGDIDSLIAYLEHCKDCQDWTKCWYCPCRSCVGHGTYYCPTPACIFIPEAP